jgi:nicotinamidase-related amidase
MQNETASLRGGYALHGYDLSKIRSIIPTIQRVREAGRSLNLVAAFAEFVHRDRRGISLMDGPNVYLHRGESWVSDVREGTWEAETIEDLAPQGRDFVIRKSRASAIHNTYLDNLLKSRGIKTVVLMGCLTDGCVLKTAVDLTEHGYYAAIVKDGVQSLTAEKHELGLRYLEMKFPTFFSSDVLDSWRRYW